MIKDDKLNEETIESKATKDSEGDPYVLHDVPEKQYKRFLTFSKNKTNILVLYNDMVTGVEGADVILGESRLKNGYKDFTIYADTISPGWNTAIGAPGLIGGNDINTAAKKKDHPNMNLKEWIDNAYLRTLNMNKDNSIDTSMVSLENYGYHYSDNFWNGSAWEAREQWKNKFPNDSFLDPQEIVHKFSGKIMNTNKATIESVEYLKNKMIIDDDANAQYKIIMNQSTHMNQVYDEQCFKKWNNKFKAGESYAFGKDLDLIEELKNKGIYDDSLIIVVSDHGSRTTPEKFKNEKLKDFFERYTKNMNDSFPDFFKPEGKQTPYFWNAFLMVKLPKQNNESIIVDYEHQMINADVINIIADCLNLSKEYVHDEKFTTMNKVHRDKPWEDESSRFRNLFTNNWSFDPKNNEFEGTTDSYIELSGKITSGKMIKQKY